jgi:predicted double-glycine peptidase
MQLTFDNYSYLLTEEIYNRHGRKAKFEEPELWYLLLVLSAAQQEIKKKMGNKVGDIRPHNVFLNQDGEAKVSSCYSWPREQTNFSKTFDN